MPRAKSSEVSERPARWTSMPSDPAIIAASRPMVPGPYTSTREPGPASVARTARMALPPGSTRAPATSSTESGSACSAVAGHEQLLGEGSGPVAADPDLVAVRAHVLAAAAAQPAVSAAEHRVAGDPSSEPARVDAVADRAHDAHPLVAEPQREVRVTLVQVGHLAGEELDVGAADADAMDVDDDLPGPRDRRLDLEHGRLVRCRDDERPHRISRDVVTARPGAAGAACRGPRYRAP